MATRRLLGLNFDTNTDEVTLHHHDYFDEHLPFAARRPLLEEGVALLNRQIDHLAGYGGGVDVPSMDIPGSAMAHPLIGCAAFMDMFEDYTIQYDFVSKDQDVLVFEVLANRGTQTVPDERRTITVFHLTRMKVPHETIDAAAATVILRAEIWRNGNSNWDFPREGAPLLRFTSPDKAGGIGRLMARMQEIAAGEFMGYKSDEIL